MGWSILAKGLPCSPLWGIIARTKISLKIQTPQKKKEAGVLWYLPCTHCAARTTRSLARGVRRMSRYSPLLFPAQRQPPAPLFRPQSQTMAAHPLFCSDSHFTCPYSHQHSWHNAHCPVLTQHTVRHLFMRWQHSRTPACYMLTPAYGTIGHDVSVHIVSLP